MIRVEGVVSMDSDTTRADTCQGHSEWADVHEGTTIAVSNGQGEVVATGVLQRGRPGPAGFDCAFSFVIVVPAGHGTYRFSVADHHSEHDFTESDIHKFIGLFAILGILDGGVINV
jgi:hypothetical protein